MTLAVAAALLSAQPGESLGLWARLVASMRSISTGVLRRMSMRPSFTTGRPVGASACRGVLDERGEPGKAERERVLADCEAQEAEADRHQAAAELEDLSPDP